MTEDKIGADGVGYCMCVDPDWLCWACEPRDNHHGTMERGPGPQAWWGDEMTDHDLDTPTTTDMATWLPGHFDPERSLANTLFYTYAGTLLVVNAGGDTPARHWS